jgi:hypothetical protein
MTKSTLFKLAHGSPNGILINTNKKEHRRRVTFSRVVILNNPTTFVLAKDESSLVRRLSDRSIR